MEFEFTLQGRKRLASRERVLDTMRGLMPDPETRWMVDIEGVSYPLTQVFCETFAVQRHLDSTRAACRVLERLGFTVTRRETGRRGRLPQMAGQAPRDSYIYHAPRHGKQDHPQPEVLEIPPIVLRWSYSERWDDVAGTGEHATEFQLPTDPGVYFVYRVGEPVLLYIGGTSNLRRRVTDALVRGKLMHIAGQKIREGEDVEGLRVAWAVTDRPAAAEEELHRKHLERCGRPPKYGGSRGTGTGTA